MQVLTFPLCLLSFQDTVNQRLLSIICYCVLTNARRNKKKQADEILQKITPPKDFNPNNETHRIIIESAYELGINIVSKEQTIIVGNKAWQFVKVYEQKYGSDAWAQIDSKIVFDTYNNQFDYDSFAILCAVSSLLGKKDKFKLIASDQIKCRMNGFKRQDILDAAVQNRGVKIIDLPYRQLLRKIDAVSKLGYFSKYTYHKKHTYYSSRLTEEQIMKAVYTRKYNAKRKAESFKVLENELEQGLQNVSNEIQQQNASPLHEDLQ